MQKHLLEAGHWGDEEKTEAGKYTKSEAKVIDRLIIRAMKEIFVFVTDDFFDRHDPNDDYQTTFIKRVVGDYVDKIPLLSTLNSLVELG